MSVSIEFRSSDFDKYVHCLLDLHRLIAQGEGDSSRADAIRDEMDAPWARMSAPQIDLVDRLSADLYSIGVVRDAPTGGSPDAELFRSAIERSDWAAALETIRKNEQQLSPAEVAFMRGACWAHLGQPDVAIVFFQEAARIQPLKPHEEVWLLTCLVQAGRTAEAVPRAQQIAQSESDSSLLLKAAEILSIQAEEVGDSTASSLHRQAIDCGERGLKLLKTGDADSTVLRKATHLHLALCYEAIGDRIAALRHCRSVLEAEPGNPNALMMHGWLNFADFPDRDRSAFRTKRHEALVETPILLSIQQANGLHSTPRVA